MPTDFGIYPPEINSLRMYTGPGPAPMLAAVQAWDAVADELYLAAGAYQSVVSELTHTAWFGPSAEAMAATAERHVRWLSSTAAHAEHTAVQARLATAAYEAAFVATVPPPAVAANRSLLAMLVATNFLGQNTPAIAATEALYAEMWAQDAVAMYTYAGSSAAAVTLSPFSPPDQHPDPAAATRQAAAVGQIIDDGVDGTHSASSAVPQTSSALASPAEGEDLPTLAALVALLLNAPGDLAAIIALAPVDALTGFVEVPPALFTSFSGLLDDDTFSAYNGQEPWPGAGSAPVLPFPANLPNLPAGVFASPTTAVLGRAHQVGRLSVPASWTVAAPEIRVVASSTPLTAAPVAEAGLPASGTGLGQMMLAQAMIGHDMAGPPPAAEQTAKPVSHVRLPGHPRAASPAPRKVVTGVVSAIRAIAKQREEGLLSDQEYDERKKELLESC